MHANLQYCRVNFGLPSDAVGAVAFHPSESFLLSVSGSRHFDDVDPSGESDSDPESGDESGEDVGKVSRLKEHPQPSVRDASIKMWDFRLPGDVRKVG